MKISKIIFGMIFIVSAVVAYTDEAATTDPASAQTELRGDSLTHSVGSTLFLLGNFVPGEPPYFFQLNYGYRLTPKDTLIAEAITWTYYEPLGTYGSSEESYPGKIRSFGLGVGYQRFYWKNLYSTIQATSFLQ